MSWIPAENFVTCLELLAFVGNTELTESFRIAFEGGLHSTSWGREEYYTLPLGSLEVSVMNDEEGTGMIHFRVSLPPASLPSTELALHVASQYRFNRNQ
ncbi:hypothetical protein MF271_09465 [Deinococcus sp. KNUC1210]|uniref:hypothetical protein n=1 Tax=Deinococcus sp. KNUC1210 TaxID=2917691 RepID=UPI001EF0FBC1|nr:hypothetical protein [Deinococcus sp. KNUC1210]ULH16770.1 hypothetical protein MF271_09465 [Deinococcus sp. KNUC1210]